MRRRLFRLLGAMVVLPVAARGADALADRLEATRGRSAPTIILRRASRLADRRSRLSRRWG